MTLKLGEDHRPLWIGCWGLWGSSEYPYCLGINRFYVLKSAANPICEKSAADKIGTHELQYSVVVLDTTKQQN